LIVVVVRVVIVVIVLAILLHTLLPLKLGDLSIRLGRF
jgi:hypothetical protein